MDIELNKEYADLSKEKRKVEAELDRIKNRMAEIEPLLLDMWAESGLDRMTVDGVTMFIHTQLWAGVADGFTREQAVGGLKAAGLGDFVTENYNSNSLSAYFREQVKQSDIEAIELPEGIKVTEKFSIRTRIS